MDYEVTAARKRPQKLSEMVGQDFVSSTLSNAIKNNTIAHAYLFSGPRGTGKTSTARILAKSLNCEKGPTVEPCGNCSSCLEIARGTSPAVIEIDGASNTGVNDVREIKDEILYPPQGAPKKIYIIDEVHMLSNSAFNALLKTIEEPPPYVVFIFATTEVHKVPATIRSRCQQFRFRLFSPELIQNKLMEAAGELNREYEKDALLWIAKEAGGSMRDAYTLFDQVLSFSDGKITLSVIRDKMGLVGFEKTTQLINAAAAGNRKSSLEIIDNILQSGVAVEQIILEISEYLRALVLTSYGVEKESILGMSPSRFSENIFKVWDIKKLEKAVQDSFNLYRDIRYSLNPRYELELFAGKLCGLSDWIDPSDILFKINSIKEKITAGGFTESEKKKSELVPSESEEEEAEKFFSSFRSEVKETGEPACAVPVNIGTGPEELSGNSRISEDQENEPEEKSAGSIENIKNLLVKEINKINLSLAAVLEKSGGWFIENEILIIYPDSAYSESVVKKDLEIILSSAEKLDLGIKAVKTLQPAVEKNNSGSGDLSPRVQMVRQIFRGQIVKGQ